MKAFVVDTSALLRFFLGDGALLAGLEDAVTSAARGDAVLVAPDLLWAEFGQVLHKKTKQGLLSVAESDEVLAAALRLPIRTLTHRELLHDALDLARTRHLTVYDALFLAAAITLGAELLTADGELASAVRA